MSKLLIEGGHALNGDIRLQGSKNSVLPILAASLAIGDKCEIHNCPNLVDVESSMAILSSLGCMYSFFDNIVIVDSSSADGYEISDELMSSMRSSVLYLGAMLAKNKRAEISVPGGCELGIRPINLHLDALSKMGAEIIDEHGHISCFAHRRLRGCVIDLPIASVGATENIMIAAATAEGTTVIRNAAKEPEIVDLADFLRAAGADISGDGSTVITINGKDKLHSCVHNVIPDRIAGATYLCAVALCGGEIRMTNFVDDHLVSVLPCFEQMGCRYCSMNNTIELRSSGNLRKINSISTKEYPGFPTDVQPMMLAAVTKSSGTSIFVENIFSNRYKYVEGLLKMGANIKVIDRVAVVEGVNKLYSAYVDAPDLRGGAALVVAALAAEGVSKIGGIEHIDRGYEKIEEVLSNLGARIKREN